MKGLFKKSALGSTGLRRELGVSFGLVLMAFLVFVGYLFPGVSSFFEMKSYIHIIIFILLVIIMLGFISIWKIIEPVIKISNEAKRIASGDFDREIQIYQGGELGELGDSLNRMTRRIKDNMEELKIFSHKTERINVEINKRILVLSSLLQISNLISQNADLDKIIELSIDKCLSSGEMILGCLVLRDKETNEFNMKSLHGPKSEEFAQRDPEELKNSLHEGILAQAILRRETVVIDKNTPNTPEIDNFRKIFSTLNAVIIPISSKGQVHGLLIVGNDKEDYTCPLSDREVLNLLAQQISIAIENEHLTKRVNKLEIVDNLTGLYNHTYVYNRLDEEIKRAIRFQRPCSFALLSVDNFKAYHEAFGRIASENALIKIGSVLKDNISEVDKAARFGDHEFALILPEKNKRQSIEIADEVRRKVDFIFSTEEDKKKRLTCTGSVTENPIDGISAEELISKAKSILQEAVLQGGNKICYKV